MHAGGLHQSRKTGSVYFVTWRPGLERSRAFRLTGKIKRFIKDAREARDRHRSGPGILERLDADRACGATGQHIVDQQNIAVPDGICSPLPDANCARQNFGARLSALSAEAWSGFAPHETIDQKRTATGLLQFGTEQRSLIEATPPQAPAVQGNRNNQPTSLCRRDARRNQSGEHWGQSYPTTVF